MHFLEVNVEKFSCLHFELPVHFIGLDGDQILQIVVEHGDPVNGRLPFNVWCSFRGSRIRGFLMAATVAETDSQIVGRHAKRYFSLSRKNAQNRCGCRRNTHFD